LEKVERDLLVKQISDQVTNNLVNVILPAIITCLEKRELKDASEVEALINENIYNEVEQLLFSYTSLKQIVLDKMLEIEDVQRGGITNHSKSVVEYHRNTPSKHGIVLPEESVDAIVRTMLDSVDDIVQACNTVDKGMQALQYDPYYKILEMRYFEGRTQEDIASEFNCSQVNISKQNKRLIRELACRMFPEKMARFWVHKKDRG